MKFFLKYFNLELFITLHEVHEDTPLLRSQNNVHMGRKHPRALLEGGSMLTTWGSLNNINNKVRGSGTKSKNSKFISQHQTIIWRSTLKRKKQKILDLEAEVRSVKSHYVNILKSSNDEIRLLESSQREADEIIAGLRGALRSYLPTSHISRFSSPFIPYAGLGINSTILPYAGGAVIFRTAKYWNSIVFK